MAAQAIGQLPSVFDPPLAVPAPTPLPPGRSVVPFLERIRTAAFTVTSIRQSVPFLQRARQTPPSLER